MATKAGSISHMSPEQTADVLPAGAAAVASKGDPSEPSSTPHAPSSEAQSSEAQSDEVPSSETPSKPPAKEHTYKFGVNMSCGGCSKAVARALTRAQEDNAGISFFDVDLEKKEVIVKGTIAYEALEDRIKKTGKTILSGDTVE